MESESGIVVAKTGFKCGNRLVKRGETFAADHPLIKGHERHFKPLVSDGVETATAEQRVEVSPLRERRTTPPRRRSGQAAA